MATIDIEKAHWQFQVSAVAIFHRAISIYVAGVALVVYTLVGWFGDAKAGHCYNVTGSRIDYKTIKEIRDAGLPLGVDRACCT